MYKIYWWSIQFMRVIIFRQSFKKGFWEVYWYRKHFWDIGFLSQNYEQQLWPVSNTSIEDAREFFNDGAVVKVSQKSPTGGLIPHCRLTQLHFWKPSNMQCDNLISAAQRQINCPTLALNHSATISPTFTPYVSATKGSRCTENRAPT